MKAIVIIAAALIFNSCISGDKSPTKHYYALKTFYDALDSYPRTDTMDFLHDDIDRNLANFNNAAANEERKKLKIEILKCDDYLSQSITTPINIPFEQVFTDKVEIISVTTAPIGSLENDISFASIGIVLKYKVLKRVRKYDFVQLRAYDNSNFCFSLFFPELSDTGVSIQALPLNKQFANLTKFIID